MQEESKEQASARGGRGGRGRGRAKGSSGVGRGKSTNIRKSNSLEINQSSFIGGGVSARGKEDDNMMDFLKQAKNFLFDDNSEEVDMQ